MLLFAWRTGIAGLLFAVLLMLSIIAEQLVDLNKKEAQVRVLMVTPHPSHLEPPKLLEEGKRPHQL